MSAVDLLPDCRAKDAKRVTLFGGTNYEPVYCGNCHNAVVWVPTEHITFVFWLCAKCETQWMPVAGVRTMPDEVFFAKVAGEQMELCGRPLTPEEILSELANPRSTISALSRDRLHQVSRKGR